MGQQVADEPLALACVPAVQRPAAQKQAEVSEQEHRCVEHALRTRRDRAHRWVGGNRILSRLALENA
jgi:hypothetical protein